MAKRFTRSSLRTITFDVSGLDEMVQRVREAGNDIEKVAARALTESTKPVLEDIEAWADKHKRTGAVREGVAVSEVKRKGDQLSVEVGLDTKKSKLAWHAVFVEYGTPTMKADPGIRRAFDENEDRVLEIQKRILGEGGIPTG